MRLTIPGATDVAVIVTTEIDADGDVRVDIAGCPVLWIRQTGVILLATLSTSEQERLASLGFQIANGQVQTAMAPQ